MFSNYVKSTYGKRTFRVGLSTGKTCPNRSNDGGCIFCNPETFTGEYQASGNTVAEQFSLAIPRIKQSCGDVALIAYFQDETSTAGNSDELMEKYRVAVEHPEVVGLTLSTRPDYLSKPILERIKELPVPVTIELGMQTMHDSSLQYLNRGHTFQQTKEALELCDSVGIRTGVHLILGIPGEDYEMMKATIDWISQQSKISEVKFHNLVVYRDTKLDEFYRAGKVNLPDKDEYIEILANLLRWLKGDIVVSRLFTSNVRQSGIARNVFRGNKTKWMNQLRLYMIEHEIIQGDETEVTFDYDKLNLKKSLK